VRQRPINWAHDTEVAFVVIREIAELGMGGCGEVDGPPLGWFVWSPSTTALSSARLNRWTCRLVVAMFVIDITSECSVVCAP
jgi:hypothetical protein